jgi:SH3-like domain-containing protein
MGCWRSGVAFAAAATAIAAACVLLPRDAAAESYRINNVDRAGRIHMRQSPSNRSKVVAYIPPAGRLEGTGACNEKWCEVTFQGRRGWIFRKYLISEPQNTAASRPAAPSSEPAVAALPKEERHKEIPSELQDTMLRLAFEGDKPIAVYAMPSDRLPAAGRIDPGTEEVEDLGICTRKYCYIRHGQLVGWVREDDIVKDDDDDNKTSDAPAAAPPAAVDATVPTATQAAGQAAASLIEGLGAIEVKTYTLAGLSGDASLPLREKPEDSGAILGWIPGDAKAVEGLRKCVLKWCLVKYEAHSGWVLRRHLADEPEAGRRFQVSGVALWGALDVVDYPGPGAAIVGHVPSYATGLVPIGNCDKDWCHVRYLGIAGWVSSRFIEPQRR